MTDKIAQEHKSTQIRHKTLLEGQKERIAVLVAALLGKYTKDILSKVDTKKPKQTLRSVNSLTVTIFKELNDLLKKELKSLGKYESDFQVEMIKTFNRGHINDNRTIKGVSDKLLNELINDRAIRGAILEDFLEDQRISLNKNVRNQFNIGLAEGLSTEQLSKTIEKNALNANIRQSTVIARTATTNVLNATKDELYKENNIKRYQYVAILDSRTTEICRKLDGKVYNVSDPTAPRPPQHLQCRSSTIPLFDNDDIIKESYKQWAARQDDKNVLVDENGNFELNKSEVISLSKLKKEEKDIIKKVKE